MRKVNPTEQLMVLVLKAACCGLGVWLLLTTMVVVRASLTTLTSALR